MLFVIVVVVVHVQRLLCPFLQGSNERTVPWFAIATVSGFWSDAFLLTADVLLTPNQAYQSTLGKNGKNTVLFWWWNFSLKKSVDSLVAMYSLCISGGFRNCEWRSLTLLWENLSWYSLKSKTFSLTTLPQLFEKPQYPTLGPIGVGGGALDLPLMFQRGTFLLCYH